MNMFARFDENPAMTLQDIKETKCYGRTDERTDAHMHGQRENSIPTPNKVCGGYVKTVYPPQTKFAGGITKPKLYFHLCASLFLHRIKSSSTFKGHTGKFV